MTELTDEFPRFHFARAADAFLRRCSTLTIIHQLRERRIDEIRILPVFSSGGLKYSHKGNFEIVLNDTLFLEEAVCVVGHEIAHTFHHNLTYSPPKNLLPESDRDEVEEFCKSFSGLWVERNSIEKVCSFLSPYFN